MSDWSPFMNALSVAETAVVQCKLCKFILNAEPDVQKIVLRALREKDDYGDFIYSAETISRALRVQEALSVSPSAVKRHRRAHEC